MFSDIFNYSIWSAILGILIGVLCLALFFFLIQGWYKNAIFRPISYIIGGILGIFLVYQSVLACGAIAIYQDVSEFEPMLQLAVNSEIEKEGNHVTTLDEGKIYSGMLILAHPLLHYYVSDGTFYGMPLSELPHDIISSCRTHFFWYVVRRVAWSIGLSAVAAIIVIKTMGKKTTRGNRRTRPVSRTRLASNTRRRR